jgi:hypothetical protein
LSNLEVEKPLPAYGMYFEGRLCRGSATEGDGELAEVEEMVAM